MIKTLYTKVDTEVQLHLNIVKGIHDKTTAHITFNSEKFGVFL